MIAAWSLEALVPWAIGVGALLIAGSTSVHGQGKEPISAGMEDAILAGNIQGVRALIDAGAEVEDPALLSFAVVKGGVEVVKLLVDAGAKINAAMPVPPEQEDGLRKVFGPSTEVVGGTALSVAALMGRLEAAEFLLDRGADPNVVTVSGTPVGMAATRGYIDVLKVLIEGGGDASGRPLAGTAAVMFSPLLGAAKAGHVGAVELLLRSGGYPCPEGSSFTMGDIVFPATLKGHLAVAGGQDVSALVDRAREACGQ
ncbi:MAG: ankyrin repeat domain-containing protein [Gammaproteobacteria bacterium]|nr:ankyrin repeat domain-containing protein [Gammaproteobacteria bacterium]MDE0177692.1 ankyrin repeat domain-containing protein [Gammaproteobacteria bacterium]